MLLSLAFLSSGLDFIKTTNIANIKDKNVDGKKKNILNPKL